MKFWSTVEAKVKAAALGTLAASAGIAVLNETVGHSEVMGGLPSWLQFAIITFGPTAITFLSGYKARHTAVAPAPVKPAA
jgi:hypothetical protein